MAACSIWIVRSAVAAKFVFVIVLVLAVFYMARAIGDSKSIDAWSFEHGQSGSAATDYG